MPEPIWVGAAPGTRIGGSTLAHAEAEMLAALTEREHVTLHRLLEKLFASAIEGGELSAKM